MVNVMLLNSEFEVSAVVDQVLSLSVKRRFFSFGTMELRLAPETIVPGSAYYIYDGESGCCAIIDRNQRLENGEVVLSGRMLEALLGRRVIYGPCQYDGLVSECAFDAVKRNAIDNRGIPGLVLGSSDDLSEKIFSSASWQNLAQWLYSVLGPCGATFKVTIGEDGTDLVFSIEKGKNLTRDQSELSPAIFSERLGNVENVTVDCDDEDFYNIAYVEGYDGTCVMYPYEIEGVRRCEMYVSAKDISLEKCEDIDDYRAKLGRRGAEKLAMHDLGANITADLVGGAYTEGMRYRLGDVCEVELMNGVYYKTRLTGIDCVTEGRAVKTKLYFGKDPENRTSIGIEPAVGGLV